MSVEEIRCAIEKLTWEERSELSRLLYGWEDDDWDKQMTADVKAGKLDKLIEKAKSDAKAGLVRDLP